MAREASTKQAKVFYEELLSDKPTLDPKLGRLIQDKIGHQLSAMYNGLMQQSVPDRLQVILQRLDRR